MSDSTALEGVWQVGTEHATYVLDFDRSTMLRRPAQAARGGLRDDSSELRRDGDEVDLLCCDPIELGQPLHMMLAIRDDGIVTERTTSHVCSSRLIACSLGSKHRLYPTLTGAWRVIAKTSHHVWDLDGHTYTRLPGPSAERMDYDGVPLKVTEVITWPTVGLRCGVWCDHPDDPLQQLFRISSRVVKIVREPLQASGAVGTAGPTDVLS